MMIDFVSMGKLLCIAREARKITQEKAAEAVDVSVETIRNIEHGNTVPNIHTIYALWDLYDLPMVKISTYYSRDPKMNERMQTLHIGTIQQTEKELQFT